MSTCLDCTPAPARPAADVVAGARAMAPWLVGIVPYGLVIGVTAARTDIPVVAGWLTAPLIFTGAAQVAVIDLLGAHAAPLVIVAAALAINLRLVLYSATMAPHWRATPRWWRALAAYLLVDPTLAVGVDGYEQAVDERAGHRWYLGAGALLWVAWLSAVAVGATAGTHLPDWLRLQFVVPLFLVGEVVPRLTSREARWATGAAVLVAVGATAAPYQIGPLLAVVAGTAVGLRIEGARR